MWHSGICMRLSFIFDMCSRLYISRRRSRTHVTCHATHVSAHASLSSSGVDEVNAQIHEELSIYGKNYNRTVSAQNNALVRQAVLPSTPVLHFSVDTAYNNSKLTYDPLSDKLYDAGKHGTVTSGASPQNPILNAIQNMTSALLSAVET